MNTPDTHTVAVDTPATQVSTVFTKKNIIIGVSALVVLIAGALYYFGVYNSPEAVASRDLEQTVAKAGKLMLLPEGETPALATVADPSKLADQPFFRNAQLGDKVLIYPVSKRAILYSPDRNMIIEVAPVNLGNPPGDSAGLSDEATSEE